MIVLTLSAVGALMVTIGMALFVEAIKLSPFVTWCFSFSFAMCVIGPFLEWAVERGRK